MKELIRQRNVVEKVSMVRVVDRGSISWGWEERANIRWSCEKAPWRIEPLSPELHEEESAMTKLGIYLSLNNNKK